MTAASGRRWAAGLAALASSLAACGSNPAAPSPGSPPVAVVGVRQISQGLFDLRVGAALAVIGQSGGHGTPSSPTAMLLRVRASVMRSLILDTVIAEEAQLHGLEAKSGEVEAEIAADSRSAGGTEALQRQLAEAGGSLEQRRDETRSRLNEQRLEDLFARQRAEDALRQLLGGADLAVVTAAYSDDEVSRSAGGGSSIDQLRTADPALAAALSGLVPGQLSAQPVRDDAGYEIVRLDAISGSSRSFHRILVSAPQPYTARQRPRWFSESLFAAVADDCRRGTIRLLVQDAGPSPCAGLSEGSVAPPAPGR